MNKLNKKLTTLILAGVCAASLGVMSANVTASAEETEAKAYNITDVFSKTSNATIASEKVNDKETIAFTLGKDDNVRLKRDLALAWYEGKNDAKYLTMKFAFKSLDFTKVTFKIETDTSEANEDDKSVNSVVFTVKNGKLKVQVFHDDKATDVERDVANFDETKKEILLELDKEGIEALGVFGVNVNGEKIGNFVKVGANYAEYSTRTPLEITADAGEDKAVVYLQEINGQRFDNVTKTDGDVPAYKVTDTALPVLVLNEEIDYFQYGTQYALNDYKKIDVLQSSSLTEKIKYYQWNPADAEVSYVDMPSSKPYFMDSVYYTKADGTGFSKKAEGEYTKATSVYLEKGEEYISVQYTLGDDSDKEGKVYDLSWYANEVVNKNNTEYIKIISKTSGASYKYIKLDDVNKVNVKEGADENGLTSEEKAYQERLTNATKTAKEGDSEKVFIPDVAALIEDENDSYRALKFTISYKTPASDGAKSSTSLSYSNLSISTPKAGTYEFKIFANDKTGNTMKYYLDGELVSVSTSNVWEIEEIPTFRFVVQDAKIQVKDKESDRKAEKILDQTYTLSSVSIIGAENSVSEYALYRFDSKAYNGKTITESKFTATKYETIRAAAMEKLDQVGQDKTYKSYFDLYLTIYAEELVKSVNGTDSATAEEIASMKACFKEINPFNSKIGEGEEGWEEHNKYNWNATAKSFTTAEEGEFLILMDVSEKDNPMQRAAGYKVVFVNSKADVIRGDSEFVAWIKNNVVSVVLFGIAGLLLIAIIVLLFIKPSEETLEEVEAKAEKKKEKKAKKEKADKE